MLSCSNPIRILLQIWFCTCPSINGHVAILGFARAFVSAFTSFLPGQTVKTWALCRQATPSSKYHCSAVLCMHFREMSCPCFRHVLAEEDVTNLVVQWGVSIAPTPPYGVLHAKPRIQRNSILLAGPTVDFRDHGWNLQLHKTFAFHSFAQVLTIILQKPQLSIH